jgi:hypothetical protein
MLSERRKTRPVFTFPRRYRMTFLVATICFKGGRTRWRPNAPTGCAISGSVASARKSRGLTAARTVRGWVDQGLSILSGVGRSTGGVRQNGPVTVRHAVGREKSVDQFGIGLLEATARHPLDPQADMLERRRVTSRIVSSVGGRPLSGKDRSPLRQLGLIIFHASEVCSSGSARRLMSPSVGAAMRKSSLSASIHVY